MSDTEFQEQWNRTTAAINKAVAEENEKQLALLRESLKRLQESQKRIIDWGGVFSRGWLGLVGMGAVWGVGQLFIINARAAALLFSFAAFPFIVSYLYERFKRQ